MIYIEELKNQVSQKEQSEIGRKLLLRGLQIEYDIMEIPEISFEKFGKPYFKSYPDIYFNISHCDRAVACIISDHEVGIDVECIKPFDKELAEYICTPAELTAILRSPGPALSFAILWTKKESYCKLTGKGLSTRNEIQEILVNNTTPFQILINQEGGFVLTYCRL